jgi:RND family efflux transporter MFP subunit
MTVFSPHRRWRVLSFGLLFVLGAALPTIGCNNAPPPAKDKRVEVTVTTPIPDDVIDYQDFTGRLDAFKTVDIRARVTGYVTEVPFKEGDVVHKGDLLFQIDPEPFRADLNLAEANLKVAETDADLQHKNLVRAEKLRETGGAISQADIDTAEAAWEKAKATIGAMKAARDKAKLYLDYARVTAPFDGRISRRYVDPGNDVLADNTLLTTLVTESPVYVYFDVDERTYLDLKASAAPVPSVGFMPLLQSKVLMRLANEDNFTHVGVVNFIDNRVSGTTGTIRMRGVFENDKGGLTSGLFARVRMPTSKPYKTLLVPDEAILSDQGRKYLYVVNADNEVEYRSVELGQSIETLRAIKKGVAEGDKVIVIGMQRVKPKQAVNVTVQEPPARPESPLEKLTRKDEG